MHGSDHKMSQSMPSTGTPVGRSMFTIWNFIMIMFGINCNCNYDIRVFHFDCNYQFWIVGIWRKSTMNAKYCIFNYCRWNMTLSIIEFLNMILGPKFKNVISTIVKGITSLPAGRQLKTSTNLFHNRVLYLRLHSS